MKDSSGHFLRFLVALFAIVILMSGVYNVRVIDSAGSTMNVNGEGSVSAIPDEAEIFVYILTEDANASAAQSQNTEISNSVISALGSIVDSDDIVTDSYYLSPKTSWDSETGQSTIYGYSVRHTLKITTGNISISGQIIDVSVNSGANGISGISFKLGKELEKQVYAQALEEAGEIAEAKAQALAESLNLRLKGIKTVSESSVYYSPYRFDSAMAEYMGTQIIPEEVEVTASIQVSYSI